jgi:hypothetical protein
MIELSTPPRDSFDVAVERDPKLAARVKKSRAPKPATAGDWAAWARGDLR